MATAEVLNSEILCSNVLQVTLSFPPLGSPNDIVSVMCICDANGCSGELIAEACSLEDQ